MNPQVDYLDARNHFKCGKDWVLFPETAQHALYGIARMVDGYIAEKVLIPNDKYTSDLLERTHNFYNNVEDNDNSLKHLGKTLAYLVFDLGATASIKTADYCLNKISNLLTKNKDLPLEEYLGDNVYRIR